MILVLWCSETQTNEILKEPIKVQVKTISSSVILLDAYQEQNFMFVLNI